MVLLLQILVVLHVLFAMTWFGAALPIPRRLRQGIALGRPAANQAFADVNRQVNIVVVASLLTIGSGVAMVLLGGGFALAPPRIHIGLGLSLLALLLGGGIERSCWKAAGKVIEGTGDLAAAVGPVRRGTMFHGMTHLLLVTVLALMLWRL